jgi:hypothetical protein
MKRGFNCFSRISIVFTLALFSVLAYGDELVEINEAFAKFEASDLLALKNSMLLDAKKWDCAFWSVSDEKEVQKNLVLIGHEAGMPLEKGWSLSPVNANVDSKSKTDDSEVMCRRGDWVYVIGSHFGKKGGPLKAARQFEARFSESGATMIDGVCSVSISIRKDEFLLHRLLNDALDSMRSEIIEPTAKEREQFIEAARSEGVKENESWVGRLKDSDWALNIEGADFLDNGSLLIGLRYPVTRDGHPILIEVANYEGFFEPTIPAPKAARVWIVENVGGPTQLTGVRSLRNQNGKIHFISGSIDSRVDVSLLLQQHPEGEAADCAHYSLTLPNTAEKIARVNAELIRVFEKTQNIEGVAFDAQGRNFYIKDALGNAPLLFPM